MVDEVKNLFRAHGALIDIRTPKEGDIDGYYVYMIYNGDDIAQIGMGSGDRMSKCMRGSLAKKHNKVFICAMLEAIKSGSTNKYCYMRVKSAEDATDLENIIHAQVGVRTNRDGATIINGIGETSIIGIHQKIWQIFKSLPKYLKLSFEEKLMAEELFEVATYATIKIRRSSGRIVPSTQGDNLEGNILMNASKRYLANMFQNLTNEYVRYGKHKLSDVEYRTFLTNFAYTPKGKPFEIRNF